MGNARKKRRVVHEKRRVRQHKISILAVSGVILMLSVVVISACTPLIRENKLLKEEEAKYEALLEEQERLEQEIEETETYIGQKEYIENVAKDKLGLAYPNEVIIKQE